MPPPSLSGPVICLLRHGLAAPPDLLTGQTDIPLAPEGEAQMTLLASRLAALPFTAAWSSPLCRARQSAALVLAANCGGLRKARIEPDLREICLGLWEGRDKNWVREHYSALWEARGRDFARTPPPGGESAEDLAARVRPAFAAIVRQAANHAFSLIAAHQAVNRVILADILGLPLREMLTIKQAPAAVNFLVLAAGGPRLLPDDAIRLGK